MRDWIWLLATLTLTVGLVGCASAPDSKLDEEKYTNHELSISADIPTGWALKDRITEDLQLVAGLNASESFDGPFLFNALTHGLVAIGGVTNDWSWTEFEDMPQTYKAKVASHFIDAMLEGIAFSLSAHRRYDENLDRTGRNWVQNRDSFKPEKMLDFYHQAMIPASSGYDFIYGEIFMYPCSGNQSCVLIAILGSKIGYHDEDMKSFRLISSSIKAHD